MKMHTPIETFRSDVSGGGVVQAEYKMKIRTCTIRGALYEHVVSSGSDGRVKIWDTYTGCLIRGLSQPAVAVWRKMRCCGQRR